MTVRDEESKDVSYDDDILSGMMGQATDEVKEVNTEIMQSETINEHLLIAETALD